MNLVRRGANYGYGEREGMFVLNLQSGNANGALPANDAANNYVYPGLQYPHSPALGYGDAITGGFVYRGTRLPQLQGKFVIGGSTSRTVLIRAAGPVLSGFGVTGVLADPKLALYRDTTVLAESDNWQRSAAIVNAFTMTGAFDFNARSRDAVLLVTLP